MRAFRFWMCAAVCLGAGCATVGAQGSSGAGGTPSLSLEGESRGRNVALQVSGELSAGKGRLKLVVENVTDEAIGIDLDEIRLQNAGRTVKVMGRPQSFRGEGGERSVRRVAHGAATVGPRERQALMLEFEDAPAPPGLSLWIPGVYKLGIEGQESQKPIKLPLYVNKATTTASSDKTAAATVDSDNSEAKDAKSAKSPKSKDGWFDPFEEW